MRKTKKVCSSGSAKVSQRCFGTIYAEGLDDGSVKIEFNLFEME